MDPHEIRIAELEQALESVRAQNTELEQALESVRAQNTELKALVQELRARLNQNSSNSSLPPSSDRPWNRGARRPQGEQGKRRRGGQKGHSKHSREFVPPEQVDELHEVFPERCAGCSRKLRRQAHGEPWRHQVTELPEVKAWVTEYRCHASCCEHCGTVTEAVLAEAVPRGMFGPRVLATVALLTGWFRLSKRNTQDALQMLFGVSMSLGAISKAEQQMAAAVAAAVCEARDYISSHPVRHADETSWTEGTRKAWLWVAATPWVSVFMIQARRAGHCARQLLGKVQGILVTDRLKSYGFWPMHQRQICWAHLGREFDGWAQRAEGTFYQVTGSALRAHVHQMFHWWHRVRDGTLSRATFQRCMRPLQKDVERLLNEGAACGDLALMGKCADILEHRQALWTFVRVEGVEPTNNRAEQDLRHAVIMRKTSFRTDSPRGSRFIERILTVVSSLRKQQRNPLVFLVACAQAKRQDRPAPSLLPT
ncbi:MAG: IS66 family transposase [Anaerolineae bacterium]|nr:IS66 family transposase [Anaerolineae bacterium]